MQSDLHACLGRKIQPDQVGDLPAVTRSDTHARPGNNLLFTRRSDLHARTESDLRSRPGIDLHARKGSAMTPNQKSVSSGIDLHSGFGSKIDPGSRTKNFLYNRGGDLYARTGNDLLYSKESNLHAGTGSDFQAAQGSSLGTGTECNLNPGTGIDLHAGAGGGLDGVTRTDPHDGTDSDPNAMIVSHGGTDNSHHGGTAGVAVTQLESQTFMNNGIFSSLPSRLSWPPLPNLVSHLASISATSKYPTTASVGSAQESNQSIKEKNQRSPFMTLNGDTLFQEIISFLSGSRNIIRNPDSLDTDLGMLTAEFSRLTMKHYGHFMRFDVKCEPFQQHIQKQLVSILYCRNPGVHNAFSLKIYVEKKLIAKQKLQT